FDQLPAGTVDSLLKPENKSMLTKILTYHVVAGTYDAKTLAGLIAKGKGKARLKTVSGGTLWAMMDGSDIVLRDEKGGTSKVTTGQDKKSLYARLGGYDAIALVVDDFITRLATDKRFEKFFTGFSDDSKKRLRQHILDQFCAAAGGPCVYTGREMRTSHKGLGITEADWDAAAKHLVDALDKYRVPEAEKNELLAFVVTQKKDIVEK